jgi:tetratricopeptide (TPR) repeat protein
MRKAALQTFAAALLIVQASPTWAAQQRPAQRKSFEQVAAQAEQARDASRTDEAIALYRQGVALRPSWAEGWWYLGTLLYDREAFADAAVAFTKAANLNPNAGTAWAMLGLCEFKLGRYEDSLEHIRRGRRLGAGAQPQLDNVTIYHEGLLLIGKGAFEEAQETLGTLSQSGVEDENMVIALGLSVLRIRFSDLLKADAAQRELVRRAGQAEHLAAQKKFDEAHAEYDRLAKEYAKAPNVQYAYGRFLVASNQDESALEAFKREVENTPGHLPARLEIADVSLRLRNAEAGLPYAEEAVKLAPKSPLAHYLLGALLVDTGQSARAISELETAQKALPNEPKIYFQLGRAYAAAGRKEDASRARATFARLSEEAKGAEQKQ